MDKWQIAGQEMGYLFTAKYKKILENLSYQVLVDALKETTVKDIEQQHSLKDLVSRCI